MGKVITIGITVLLQLLVVLAFHINLSNSPREVIIVVESSYGLTEYQNDMLDKIEEIKENSRYKIFHYGTDKSYIGPDGNIDEMFKVNFGKADMSKLKELYPDDKYDKKYLLVFTEIKNISGWNIINIKEK